MSETYELDDALFYTGNQSNFTNLTASENNTLSNLAQPISVLIAESLFCSIVTLIVIIFSSFSLAVFLFSPQHFKASFHKPAGFIMIWLSANDFISGFCLLLPMAVTVISGHEWLFGRFLCIVQGLVLQLIQNSTNTLLTWAAIDRFCALVLPIRYIYWVSQLTTRGYCAFGAMIILYSCLFPICNIAIYQSMFFDGQLLCFIYSPSLAFICSNFVVNALVPLLIMTTCYALVIITLCQKKYNNPDQDVCLQPNNCLDGFESGKCTPSPLSRTPTPMPSPALIAAPAAVASNLTNYALATPALPTTVLRTPSNTGRRHVSVARAREESQLIKRVFKLFFIITIIFTLTWIPYMTVDFYYGGMAPHLVYRVTTYLIFTTSATNFPLFLAYNRKFRCASLVLLRLILRLDKSNIEATRRVTATSLNLKGKTPARGAADAAIFAHNNVANDHAMELLSPHVPHEGVIASDDRAMLCPRILITPEIETAT